MKAPKTLNGYPVIASARRTDRSTEMLALIVFRAGQRVPYVTCTWAPMLGNEWSWGEYHATIGRAAAKFDAMTQERKNI